MTAENVSALGITLVELQTTSHQFKIIIHRDRYTILRP